MSNFVTYWLPLGLAVTGTIAAVVFKWWSEKDLAEKQMVEGWEAALQSADRIDASQIVAHSITADKIFQASRERWVDPVV